MFLKINKRGVRLGVALIGGVCVSVPLLRCNTVRAAAAALEEYTLTAEQALALYGSQIDLEIYANGSTYHKNATYVGTSSAMMGYNGYPNTGSDPSQMFAYGQFSDTTYDWMNLGRMQSTEYLIYKIYVDPWSQPYSQPFSINLTNSIDITAYGFGTSILWSVSPDPGTAPNNQAFHQYYNCSYTLYNEQLTALSVGGPLVVDTTSPYNSYYAAISCIPYPIEVVDSQGLYIFQESYSWQGFGSYYGAVSFAGSQVSGGDPVTVSQQVIYIKNEGNIYPKTAYSATTGTYYNKKYNMGDNSDYAVYLFIQCPTLYGDYILPGGGDSGDIDLSQIEEYLEEQTEYMSNVSEEATVHTRQLIAILAKLEQIYQAMPDLSGLNVPTLQTAPQIPIDSDIDSRISADLSSGAELLPDISEEFDTQKMQSFSDLLTRVRGWFPSEIITIGGLSLALAFVTWLIFRGRGS